MKNETLEYPFSMLGIVLMTSLVMLLSPSLLARFLVVWFVSSVCCHGLSQPLRFAVPFLYGLCYILLVWEVKL